MKKRSTMGTLLVIIGIVGLLYVFFSGGKSPLEGMTSFFTSEINERQSIDVKDISNVDIKSGSLDVHVIKGSGSEALITLQGRASKTFIKNLELSTESRGDTLAVSLEGDRGYFLGFGWSDVLMTVELPEQTWNQLMVEVSSGDITVEQLQFNEANLDTSSGDIHTDRLTTLTTLKVNTSSGDLALRKLEGKSVELKINSGDTLVEEYTADQIEFQTDSGDVAFVDGFAQLKGNVSSGDIMVEAERLAYDADLRTSSGDVVVQLDETPASLAVEFNAGSGDGVIRKDGFTYSDGSGGADHLKGAFGSGEIKLNVKTGSGDFILK